jgi:hypothetical protein
MVSRVFHALMLALVLAGWPDQGPVSRPVCLIGLSYRQQVFDQLAQLPNPPKGSYPEVLTPTSTAPLGELCHPNSFQPPCGRRLVVFMSMLC